MNLNHIILKLVQRGLRARRLEQSLCAVRVVSLSMILALTSLGGAEASLDGRSDNPFVAVTDSSEPRVLLFAPSDVRLNEFVEALRADLRKNFGVQPLIVAAPRGGASELEIRKLFEREKVNLAIWIANYGDAPPVIEFFSPLVGNFPKPYLTTQLEMSPYGISVAPMVRVGVFTYTVKYYRATSEQLYLARSLEQLSKAVFASHFGLPPRVLQDLADFGAVLYWQHYIPEIESAAPSTNDVVSGLQFAEEARILYRKLGRVAEQFAVSQQFCAGAPVVGLLTDSETLVDLGVEMCAELTSTPHSDISSRTTAKLYRDLATAHLVAARQSDPETNLNAAIETLRKYVAEAENDHWPRSDLEVARCYLAFALAEYGRFSREPRFLEEAIRHFRLYVLFMTSELAPPAWMEDEAAKAWLETERRGWADVLFNYLRALVVVQELTQDSKYEDEVMAILSEINRMNGNDYVNDVVMPIVERLDLSR